MPGAKKKITTFEQVVLIAFGLLVEGVQFILSILVIGVILNPIISVIVIGIFFLYARSKGLDSKSWKVYASMFGTAIGESIPLLNLLPFFALNAWRITHAIKVQDKAAEKTANEKASEDKAAEEQEQQEWIANYQMQQQELVSQEEAAKEEQLESENTTPKQETMWQNDGGAGRIAPLQFKMPSGKKQSNVEQYREAA